jgi:uncharacterized protein (DUF4213/DUF364 family)
MKEMKLLDDIISTVEDENAPAGDVRVGVSWTGVKGRYGGVCKTYGIPVPHGNYTHDLGKLNEKSTLELAEYARSWNFAEASIGVAALNSMVKVKGKTGVNAIDIVLETCENKNVTMVGKFPRTGEIKALARELWVLEMNPCSLDLKKGIINATAAEYVIPDSDIVIVTGSTLINKTMERVLELCKMADAYTIVMGPSTTMSDVLFDYGADMLAGVEIVKPEAMLNIISQSGGMINSKICRDEIVFRVLEG